jgi:hypothetical protein
MANPKSLSFGQLAKIAEAASISAAEEAEAASVGTVGLNKIRRASLPFGSGLVRTRIFWPARKLPKRVEARFVDRSVRRRLAIGSR